MFSTNNTHPAEANSAALPSTTIITSNLILLYLKAENQNAQHYIGV
jgi:hypothetical protein